MDLFYEEENLTMKSDFVFNRTFQDLCEMRTVWHMLSESVLSHHFDLFLVYFGMHTLVLFYNVFYKWNSGRSRDMAFYIRRTRKHVGCMIGFFSIMISYKFYYSEGNCQSDVYIALFSFLLTAVALFCYRRFQVNCFTVLSIIICVGSTFVVIASVSKSLNSKAGLDFTAPFLHGILHLALGITLFLVSQRDKPRGKIFLPHSRNLFYIELTK